MVDLPKGEHLPVRLGKQVDRVLSSQVAQPRWPANASYVDGVYDGNVVHVAVQDTGLTEYDGHAVLLGYWSTARQHQVPRATAGQARDPIRRKVSDLVTALVDNGQHGNDTNRRPESQTARLDLSRRRKHVRLWCVLRSRGVWSGSRVINSPACSPSTKSATAGTTLPSRTTAFTKPRPHHGTPPRGSRQKDGG